MRKNFTTGLLILLPIVITFLLVNYLVVLLTAPFHGIIKSFYESLGYINPSKFAMFVSEILVLVFLFGLIIFVGRIASNIFVMPFLRVMERVLKRIPLINHLYLSLKAVIYSLLHEKSPTFSEVVLVKFPGKNSYALGFITRKDLKDKDLNTALSVFIPGTPNPTFGFMFTYLPQDVIFLDMSVSKGIKLLVSAGVIYEK